MSDREVFKDSLYQSIFGYIDNFIIEKHHQVDLNKNLEEVKTILNEHHFEVHVKPMLKNESILKFQGVTIEHFINGKSGLSKNFLVVYHYLDNWGNSNIYRTVLKMYFKPFDTRDDYVNKGIPNDSYEVAIYRQISLNNAQEYFPLLICHFPKQHSLEIEYLEMDTLHSVFKRQAMEFYLDKLEGVIIANLLNYGATTAIPNWHLVDLDFFLKRIEELTVIRDNTYRDEGRSPVLKALMKAIGSYQKYMPIWSTDFSLPQVLCYNDDLDELKEVKVSPIAFNDYVLEQYHGITDPAKSEMERLALRKAIDHLAKDVLILCNNDMNHDNILICQEKEGYRVKFIDLLGFVFEHPFADIIPALELTPVIVEGRIEKFIKLHLIPVIMRSNPFDYITFLPPNEYRIEWHRLSGIIRYCSIV